MGTSGVAAGVIRNTDSYEKIGTAAKLLKKAMESDKSLVQTLLQPMAEGRLDIRA